jgi:hypothetical protein
MTKYTMVFIPIVAISDILIAGTVSDDNADVFK